MNEQDRVVLRDIADQFRRIADMLEPLVAAWMKNRPVPNTPARVQDQIAAILARPAPKVRGRMSSGVSQIPPVYLAAVFLILAGYAFGYLVLWLVNL